jgi:hypothetical protein
MTPMELCQERNLNSLISDWNLQQKNITEWVDPITQVPPSLSLLYLLLLLLLIFLPFISLLKFKKSNNDEMREVNGINIEVKRDKVKENRKLVKFGSSFHIDYSLSKHLFQIPSSKRMFSAIASIAARKPGRNPLRTSLGGDVTDIDKNFSQDNVDLLIDEKATIDDKHTEEIQEFREIHREMIQDETSWIMDNPMHFQQRSGRDLVAVNTEFVHHFEPLMVDIEAQILETTTTEQPDEGMDSNRVKEHESIISNDQVQVETTLDKHLHRHHHRRRRRHHHRQRAAAEDIDIFNPMNEILERHLPSLPKPSSFSCEETNVLNRAVSIRDKSKLLEIFGKRGPHYAFRQR